MTTNSETKQIRRVVTGHANGKSVIKSDAVLSTYHFKAVPGFEHTMIWASNGIPNLDDEPKADYPSSVIPVPGATNIQVVLFPGGYPAGPALQSAVIDREAAGREYLERLPGLAETFERDQPAMHATPTVDYAVVLEGEIWLEVDDHQTVHLRGGDVVIQNGTRHGWRNKGGQSATLLFVLHGANQ
jgi:mannose-6-phosphate isomerase-like protein (cupin superfamily)